MIYKDFIKKNRFRVLLDESDESSHNVHFCIYNDRRYFDSFDIKSIIHFCHANKLFYEICIFSGVLVCRIFNFDIDDF